HAPTMPSLAALAGETFASVASRPNEAAASSTPFRETECNEVIPCDYADRCYFPRACAARFRSRALFAGRLSCGRHSLRGDVAIAAQRCERAARIGNYPSLPKRAECRRTAPGLRCGGTTAKRAHSAVDRRAHATARGGCTAHYDYR